MQIVYNGYYGAKNSGDDAFMEVAAWGTQKYWGCDKHIFLAREAPEILTRVEHFYPYKNYLSFLKTIYTIFKSDVFISAGGSTFHSSLKKTDPRFYAKIKKGLPRKSVVGAIGISLGPYRNAAAEQNTISYLKQLDFLALRDTKSYQIACSYNLPYKPIDAFDLAALLPDIYHEEKNKFLPHSKSDEKILGISVCNYERYSGGDLNKEEKRNNFIKNVLSQLTGNKKIKFRFFIFNGNSTYGDETLTQDIIKQLQANGLTNFEVVPYLNNVKATWDKIKECDLVIATRLHAGIFACFANIPFFLIEYHRKCSDFLDDVGYKKEYRLFNDEHNIKTIIEIIHQILFDTKYDYPSNKIIVQNKALKNFTETFKAV